MTDLSQSRAAFAEAVGTSTDAADGPVVAHVTAPLPPLPPPTSHAALSDRGAFV